MPNRNKTNFVFASTSALKDLNEFRKRTGMPAKFVGDAMIHEYLIRHDPQYRQRMADVNKPGIAGTGETVEG